MLFDWFVACKAFGYEFIHTKMRGDAFQTGVRLLE